MKMRNNPWRSPAHLERYNRAVQELQLRKHRLLTIEECQELQHLIGGYHLNSDYDYLEELWRDYQK